MQSEDRYGFPLSTSSSQAAAHYQHGVDLMMSAWPGADAALDLAIAADPQFALALAARARVHATYSETAQARTMIGQATSLAALNGTARERSHIEVLGHSIHGRSPQALTSAMTHLEQWPRDIMIMSLLLGAFGLLAFSGMPDHDQARVDLCDRHAAHFGADDWWFLTYRGWSHAENGNVQLGRSLIERALELHPANAGAAHALAHAMYEQGAGAEAEKYITAWLPGYGRSGILHGHLAWHSALLALERGDAEEALSLYQQHVAPPVSQALAINIVSDAAALLWRLQAYGHPVDPQLWQEAADYARARYARAGHAFVDAHMAMLAAATGDTVGLRAREAALNELVQSGTLPAGPVVPAICRALQAFAGRDYRACVKHLEPVARDVARIGGSGAQQEIFEDTLLLSWMHSGETRKAQTLLHERLSRRPSPRDSRWLATLKG